MTDERGLSDPAPDATWRRHSTEEPPAHLDAAILAAAHRAVMSAPSSAPRVAAANRPWRWWAPLAAAATIGAVAIGVLQLLPSDRDSTSSVVSDTSSALPPAAPAAPVPPSHFANTPPSEEIRKKTETPREAAPASAAPAPAKVAPPPKAATRATDAPVDKLRQQPPAAPEPFPARKDMAPQQEAPPPPAPAASAVREIERAQLDGNAGAAAGRVNAQDGAAAPLMSKKALRDEAKAERDPADWIARIRKLLTEDNAAEAARELGAFRAAFADADQRLPEELRPWAATVKRPDN